jgi:subtilisin family serine protease
LETRELLAADLGITSLDWNGREVDAIQGSWILNIDGLVGTAVDQQQQLASMLSGISVDGSPISVVRQLGLNGLFEIQAASTADMTELTTTLGTLSGFGFLEPNVVMAALNTPNDTLYTDLYGLNNTGQDGGTIGADIDAEKAWDITTDASSVVVAIIDTGADLDHPDLAANIWVNPGEIANDGIDNDNNGYIDDVNGYDFGSYDSDPSDTNTLSHGTHVAGIIGAVGNNSTGVTGVAWNTQLMILKVEVGISFSASGAISAMNYATMMRRDYGINVVVTNHSYYINFGLQAIQRSIEAAAAENILTVVAAGNDGNDNDSSPDARFPASLPSDSIISVAYTNRLDELGGASNYGAQTVDVGAPGSGIMSTTNGGNYGLLGGTSMAAPVVTGIAALLYSQKPTATYSEVKQAILQSVDPLPTMAGKAVTEGRVNAFNALLNIRKYGFLANANISDSQTNSSVASDDSGNYVVVWQSHDQDGDGWGIYGRRFDADGVPQGDEFLINSVTTGLQGWPSVSMADNGDFVVAWTNFVSGVATVWAQRFDAGGTPAGSVFQLGSGQIASALPKVAMQNTGEFIITWLGSTIGGNAIYAQQFDASGVALGSAFQVSTSSIGSEAATSIDVNGNGDFVIAWASGLTGGLTEIYARLYDSSGTPVTSEVAVNTFTSGRQMAPAVAIDGSGAFVVTWQDTGTGVGDDRGIIYRRFDSSGAALAGEQQVVGASSAGHIRPAIASDSAGNFAITWDGPDGLGDTDIFIQRFTSAGSAVGSIASLHTVTGIQSVAAISSNDSGQLTLSWTNSADGAEGGDDIQARSFVMTNSSPVADAGGAYTVREGGTLTLDGYDSIDTDGDWLTYEWDLNGDGIFGDAVGIAPVLQWTDLVALGLDDGPTTFMNVAIRVSDGISTVTSATTTIDILNGPPLLVMQARPSGSTPLEMTFDLLAWDFGAADPSGTFTYEIDWNGDGIFDQTVVGTQFESVVHVFSGVSTVIVRASDGLGYTSPVSSVTVDPSSGDAYFIGSDRDDDLEFTPLSTTGVFVHVNKIAGETVSFLMGFVSFPGDLYVFGQSGDDILDASAMTTKSMILVGGNGDDLLIGGALDDYLVGDLGTDFGLSVSNFALGSDTIHGGDGNDLIYGDGVQHQVSSNDVIYGDDGDDIIYGDSGGYVGIHIAGWDTISGGDGDDRIFTDGGNDVADGGNGNDLLVGGDGAEGAADSLLGGIGRDVIIGGVGRDTIDGGADEDLIITDVYEPEDDDALDAIYLEWTTETVPADAADHLINGGGVNDPYLLEPGTNAFHDDSIDSVLASDGDLDFVLIDLNLDIHDTFDLIDVVIDMSPYPA